jgi:glycosyltransferase involved in cell wall biosynthesis
MQLTSPLQATCVIPHGGSAVYLREAVLSAVAQGFAETIVVNDGSPPSDLDVIADLPAVRTLHLRRSLGPGKARTIGVMEVNTPYVALLDHDDILCRGYFAAVSRWMTDSRLRCSAATLRYIGHDSRRVGTVVSRAADFCLPSGFIAEVSLIEEAGYFQDSISEDVLFFRELRKITTVSRCPAADVLYRIHPQSGGSLNAKAWWAFHRLLPLHDRGLLTLPETNRLAREFAGTQIIPDEFKSLLQDDGAAETRLLSRSAYACWLNGDLASMSRCGVALLPHLPRLWRLAQKKWSTRPYSLSAYAGGVPASVPLHEPQRPGAASLRR